MRKAWVKLVVPEDCRWPAEDVAVAQSVVDAFNAGQPYDVPTFDKLAIYRLCGSDEVERSLRLTLEVRGIPYIDVIEEEEENEEEA